MNDDAAFYLRLWFIEPVLLTAPAFAFVGFRIHKWLAPQALRRWIITLLVFTGAGAIVTFSPWSLRTPSADTLVSAMSYIAAVTVAFAFASLIGRRSIRRLLSVIFGVFVVMGVIVGTVGILGLMFVIGDSIPRQQAALSEFYSYQISYSGGAYSSQRSAEIKLFYYSPYLPLRKRVWSRSFDSKHYAYQKGGMSIVLAPEGRDAIISVPTINGDREVERVNLR